MVAVVLETVVLSDCMVELCGDEVNSPVVLSIFNVLTDVGKFDSVLNGPAVVVCPTSTPIVVIGFSFIELAVTLTDRSLKSFETYFHIDH